MHSIKKQATSKKKTSINHAHIHVLYMNSK
jgi:hypothetical protein